MRRLRIALPVKFALGVGLEQQVSDALRRSPRFEERNDGFTINVQSNQVCLLGTMGQQLSCASFPVRAEDIDDDEYVTVITEQFHTMAFAMATGMSTSDWNSLDGRAISSKQRSQNRIQELLQQGN